MGIKKDFLPAAFTADEIRRGIHLDPAAPSVSLSSFAKAPFLLLRPETIAYERAVKLCSQNGFAPNIRLQLDQLATAYRSCGAGLGVTLLSDTVVRSVNPVTHTQIGKSMIPQEAKHSCQPYHG